MSIAVLRPHHQVDWIVANQHYLYAAIETVRASLIRRAGHDADGDEATARERLARDRA